MTVHVQVVTSYDRVRGGDWSFGQRHRLGVAASVTKAQLAVGVGAPDIDACERREHGVSTEHLKVSKKSLRVCTDYDWMRTEYSGE